MIRQTTEETRNRFSYILQPTKDLVYYSDSAQVMTLTQPTIEVTNSDSKSLNETIENKINEILAQFGAKPLFQHTCHNCGAQLELSIEKHIFICPYCDSVYMIGTEMINDRG